MEHIFEAFQNSFVSDEKAIFITNVKDNRSIEGDLMLTNKRMVFYPSKPKTIQEVLFIDIALIEMIERTQKGIQVFSGDKKGSYEIDYLKEDFIEKIKNLNPNIKIT